MTRVFCGLPLCIVEVRGNGYDRLRNFFSEKLRSALLKPAKYECGNLWRAKSAVAHLKSDHLLASGRDLKRDEAEIFLNVCASHPHESFYRIDRLARFGDQP